jgi:hypothetical protein
MANTTTLPTYPMFGAAGGVHVRVFDADMARSRHADVAAVAVAALHEGRRVVVASWDPVAVRSLAGLARFGELESRIDCRDHRSLVALSAAVFDAWASGEPVTVVVDNFTTLHTGPHGAQSDSDATAWAAAVAAGDAARVEALCGLSYAGYLRSLSPARPASTAVVVCTQTRRRAAATELAAMMAGDELRRVAVSVTAVEPAPTADLSGQAAGAATVLGVDGSTVTTVALTRPREGRPGFWRAAA